MAIFRRKKYLEKIEKELKDKQTILFLIGARQVGKTTLLKSLIEFGLVENYTYISFDNFNFKNFESFDSFWDFIISQGNSDPEYILLDEIQFVENIGVRLKNLIDFIRFENKNIKVIASGSGSLQVFQGISDSLIGRKKIIQVYPFSFEEFLDYKGFDLKFLDKNKMYEWNYEKLSILFEEFLTYGGYPAVVVEENKNKKTEILKGILNDYFVKDVNFFLKQQELISFKKFFSAIAWDICSLVKVERLVEQIGIKRDMVEYFLSLLKSTFVFDFLQSFGKNTDKVIKKHNKIYFLDTGLLRIIFGVGKWEGDLRGKAIENFVENELQKNKSDLHEIYFYRKLAGTEIDFIVKNIQTGKLIPIEVKTTNTDNIPKAFKFFYSQYGNLIEKFIVLNQKSTKQRNFEDKIVEFLPHFLVKEIFLINF